MGGPAVAKQKWQDMWVCVKERNGKKIEKKSQNITNCRDQIQASFFFFTRPFQEELYDFKNKWPPLWTCSFLFSITDKLTFYKVQAIHLQAAIFWNVWRFSDRWRWVWPQSLLLQSVGRWPYIHTGRHLLGSPTSDTAGCCYSEPVGEW